MSSNEVLNQKTKERYSLYAQFYPILALIAYYIVWRGNIIKHIQFFRALAEGPCKVLDIATGDGSLTMTALNPAKNPKIEKLICLDISPDMLNKARTNLKSSKCEFVLGDVGRMPFKDGEFSVISCFGGLNSFPDSVLALKEINRVMAPGGRVRGSVLLLPSARWRQNLILKWIKEGYQTQTITLTEFKTWVAEAGLRIFIEKHMNDVLLFELEKASS